MTVPFPASRWSRRVAVLAVAVAAAAASAAAGGADSASATCWAHAKAPYYDAGTIKAWGYVECNHTAEWGWAADGYLKRDGTEVDQDGCWHDNTPGRCHVTPAAPNRSGDQRWCHRVYGGDPNYSAVADTACESEGF
ncbi:MAG TPA: hypothetical protein VGW75_03075 [Solirubrobacteraceae bacterium]|jgi:hypothetical protein|nr:hypothetical protein [Solirubrobacteraceae bacterium]